MTTNNLQAPVVIAQEPTSTQSLFQVPTFNDTGEQLPSVTHTNGAVSNSQVHTAHTVEPVAGTKTSSIGRQHSDVEIPPWMKDEDVEAIKKGVVAWMQLICSSPTDAKIITNVTSIGKGSNTAMTPSLELYNVKISDALGNLFQEEGSPLNKTLLDIKRELDMVNPSVLKKEPVAFRFLSWFFPLLSRLPNGDEVIKKVYENRETVMSVVSGLKRGLLAERDKIQTFAGEITTIYEKMLQGDRQLDGEILFADLLLLSIDEYRTTLTDPRAVSNIEEVQGTLQRKANFLREQKVMNLQFFDGAQSFARNARMQLESIEQYAMLEQAILAALGLKTASRMLAKSVELTQAMGRAISDTIADTAAEQRRTGELLMKAQKSTSLDLQQIEAACDNYEALYQQILNHNRQLITEGSAVGNRLKGILAKGQDRVESGHNAMLKKD